MRRTLTAMALLLGLTATASAQVPLPLQGSVRVVISDAASRTDIRAASAPYTGEWPLATVPARALKAGVRPTVPEFRVRAWEEGEGARVVVFAVTASGPKGAAREERVASVFVPIDQFVEIASTETYRAQRITLVAYRLESGLFRQTPPGPIRGIDIPLRPWTPTQRPR